MAYEIKMTLTIDGYAEAEVIADALIQRATTKLIKLGGDGCVFGSTFSTDMDEIMQLLSKAEEVNRRVGEKSPLSLREQ